MYLKIKSLLLAWSIYGRFRVRRFMILPRWESVSYTHLDVYKRQVFHINDSKNAKGASKDRHANLGFGTLGFDALCKIVYHKDFKSVPKILETPYIQDPEDGKKSHAPYKHEIRMLREMAFDDEVREKIIQGL